MARIHAETDTFFLREAMQKEHQTILATNRKNGSLSTDPLRRGVFSGQPEFGSVRESLDNSNYGSDISPSGFPKMHSLRHIPNGPPDLKVAGNRMTFQGGYTTSSDRTLSRISSPSRRPTSPVFGSGFNWKPKGSIYTCDYEWPNIDASNGSASAPPKKENILYGELTKTYDREHSQHFTNFAINKSRRRKPKTATGTTGTR